MGLIFLTFSVIFLTFSLSGGEEEREREREKGHIVMGTNTDSFIYTEQSFFDSHFFHDNRDENE